MTTMVALVGDQTQPNFLPILHYKPEHVLLAYTLKKTDKYNNLYAALTKHGFTTSGVEVDAYEISSIVKTLNDKFNSEAGLFSMPLVFNLTGGTKTMALAAYQVAEQRNASVFYLNSEQGPTIIDHYLWQDRKLIHQKQEQIDDTICLRDVLELQLGPQKGLNGKNEWKTHKTTGQENGGHLFELAINEALSNGGYETIPGVKGKRDQLDIDVMVRHQNQIGIIEAKTGKNAISLEGVRQLSTATSYLRGTYIQQFLILDRKASDDQTAMCKILHIQIISLENYKQWATVLPPEDIETLYAGIEKHMRKK